MAINHGAENAASRGQRRRNSSIDEGQKQFEREFMHICARVLKTTIDDLDRSSSFVFLGGDSLSAIRLIAECADSGIEISTADVIKARSLSELFTTARRIASDEALGPTHAEHERLDTVPFELWASYQHATEIEQKRQLEDIAKSCDLESDQIKDVYPCTPLQEGLIAITSRQPLAYIERRAFTLTEEIDSDRFEAAWEELVATTPILRTRIVVEPSGASLQVVTSDRILWRYSSDLEAYLARDRLEGMTVGQPLVRFGMVQRASRERIFVWTAHHSIYDGWSALLLYRRLAAIYLRNEIPRQVPYTRFLQYLAKTKTQSTANYWRGQLEGDVTAEWPRLPNANYQSHPRCNYKSKITVPTNYEQGPVMMSNILRAAWALVMAQYAGQDDVVFAVTVSGRNAPIPQVGDIVAPTITTVPVRIRISRNTQTVANFLQAVQNQAAEMIDYEHTGLQKIKALLPDNSAALELRNLLIIQPASEENAYKEFPGLAVLPLPTDDFDNYPLNLECILGPKDIGIDVNYDSEVIDTAQLQGIVNQFSATVTRLCDQSASAYLLKDITTIRAEDQQKICHWNREIPASTDRCIQDLVEDQVKLQPTASAVDAWDGELTYSDLYSQSLRLAHHLIELGIRPESTVGLCMDKSKWAVVAMLATLLAGAAVLPLSVAHPIERIRGIITEADTHVLLVDDQQKHRLAVLETNLLVLSSSFLQSVPSRDDPPQTGIRPSNPAWIMYTSGSTGKPKGVVLEHRSLCTSLVAHGKAMRMSNHTRTLQFAAYTFDVSLCDTFSTLQAGGCVCIPSEEQRLNTLTEMAHSRRVNYAELTSTVAETIDPSQVPSLSTLALSGEPLKPTVLSTWSKKATVINSYGPTECSIVSSNSKRLHTVEEAANIGKPMKSVFWVAQTADHNRLCPIGAPGELLIEGPLLARGYLNDKVKTSAAFITDPAFIAQLGLGHGRRMYRTGDLVRQNHDGSLMYLGRCESTQIKIRGQRVEVSEIEYQIMRHLRSVRTVAVELLQQGMQMSLVAVIEFTRTHGHTSETPLSASSSTLGTLLLTDDLTNTLEDLRNKLFQELPTYMVPPLYIPVASIPLNASGKLDRKLLRTQLNALSMEDLQKFASSGAPKIAPSTAMERQLQILWATTLAVRPETIGSADNFFRLGGDSVAAMRMVTMKASRSLSLTVADIFTYQQLSELALILEQRSPPQNEEESDPTPFELLDSLDARSLQSRIQRIETVAKVCNVTTDMIEDIYPCTPLQEGLVALTAIQSTAYISRQVFKLATSIDMARFQASWQALARQTPILRTRIVAAQDVDGSSLQVVVHGQLLWRTGHSLEEYLSQDQEEGISLGQPLVRFGMVKESNEQFFVWTAHHSVYDGWSAALMYRHLTEIYQNNTLPTTVPYTRFIRYLLRRDTEATAHYWTSQLQGSTATNWPPLPREDHHVRPTCKHVSEFTLSNFSMSSGDSMISNVLRAAWALVMAKHIGQNDVMFGVTVSGRNAPVWQIAEMTAPTLTTVPVRIAIDRDQCVRDFLQSVQSQTIRMIEYEHTGLQTIKKLVSNLGSGLELRNLLVIQPPADKESIDFPGLEALPVNLEAFDSYGLTVECSLGPSSIKVEARFDDAVITKTYVKRVVKSFEHVIQQLCDSRTHSTQVGEISALTSDDEAAIMKWNANPPPRVEKCINEMVWEIIDAIPNALAVSAWDGELTYGKLGSQANQLANHLMRLGVTSERMVGVCMDKSKWAAVSMLAILQAGGVVVPLGVNHPRDRVEGIVAEIQADIVLVDAKQRQRLSGLNVMLMTVDESLLGELPPYTSKVAIKGSARPENAAWVIYTSGTTGKPKGSILQHSALASSIQAHGARFGMGAHTRMFQFAAHTFDACIQDYFTTLSWGGVVCVPSEDSRMSDLTATIRSMGVNFATLTSTVARLITPSQTPSMRKIALVGEPVKADVVDLWLPHAEVLNAYGPSECSIHSTCNGPITDSRQSAVIGRAMGTRLWVTDPADYNQLSPVGAPGELLIEGPLLAREYFNESAKTRDAFIIDPSFAQTLGLEPGIRLYRTGDLVKYGEDGSLIHLGRRDTQIKIRGQRVEVGEIEYHISQNLPDTRTVAVELVEDGSKGEPVVLAAVVDFTDDSEHRHGNVSEEGILTPSPEIYAALEQLRGSLFQILPIYMVPSLIVPILDLPFNANGKLDRRAVRTLLQKLSSDNRQQYSSLNAPKIKPTSPMEQYLQTLWAEALGLSVEQIGAYDNFFQLGGDSVVAMRMVATTKSQTVHVTVADIFQYPRLNDLAIQLSQRLSISKEDHDPAPFELWLDESCGPESRHQQLREIAKQCNVDIEQIQDVYPSTPLQEGLIAITARQPSAYINRQAYKLSADINIDRFKESWQALSRLTPILRTRILTSQGSTSTMQVVIDETIPWHHETSLEHYMARDRSQGMGPGTALMRFGLVQDGSTGDRYFIWTAHHSLYDGWSSLLMYQHLADLYFRRLDPVPVPFTRFVKYLAQQRKTSGDSAAYWSDQLQGDVMANWPSMPHIDYQPRPRYEVTEVATLPERISRDGVTTSNVLRAAWALTMAQYSGHNDVVFAVTVSGRNAPLSQVESIVAPMFTTVPVRIQIDWSQDAGLFLQSVQQQAAEMINYEHIGLREIKALVPDLITALDLKNVLVVQTAEERNTANQFPGIEPLPREVDDFDSHGLTVDCTVSTDELRVDMRYDDQIVSTPQVKRIARQFTHLAQQLYDTSKTRACPLARLSLTCPEDVGQVMKWNSVQYPRTDSCIHALVQQQVLSRPHEQAVCAWDGNLTYRQLSDRAANLAHQLINLGVGPEQKVGLCMDKSKWAIVGMLAILNAGGAIVPLGVSHPIARVDVMVKDAAASVILVDAQQKHRLAGLGSDTRLLVLDEKMFDSMSDQLEMPKTSVTSANAAWIIYTSGSTGTPKGMVLEHGGLCTSMRTQGQKMHISADTRALQFSPFTFDVSISDISATLIYGGCVCLLSETDRVNNLAGSARTMNVNFASLTPTVAQMLSPAEVPCLKTLALTGEALKAEVVKKWVDSAVLYDTYGPSEGSVCTCNGPITKTEQAGNIGFPMSTFHWVTLPHDHNQLCPIGAPGELLIEGPMLAREYLNNPEKTKSSFVVNPGFVKQLPAPPSAHRMYRTGDLVRQNEDGSFVYLGRRDTQIKIRGQRVEVGEIEFQIGTLHPDIQRAAVDLIHDGPQMKLVAMVEFMRESQYHQNNLDSSGTLEPSSSMQSAFSRLRKSLLQVLPTYMVPALYVPVAQVPMNISGKLDRRAVHDFLTAVPSRTLEKFVAIDESSKIAPTTQMEKDLQGFWAEALGTELDKIGSNDNFFQLGGDSVTAMQIVAATTKKSELQLTVSDIFQNPRLSDLAEVLMQRGQTEPDAAEEDPEPFSMWTDGSNCDAAERMRRLALIASQCETVPEHIEDIYPCTPLQEGLLALTARQSSAYVSRQVYGLTNVDIARFKAAWQKVAMAVPILRTRALMGAGNSLQVVVQEPITWNIGSSLEQYIKQDEEQGIKLGQPLARYGLIDQPSGESFFVWTAHHSIYDGWAIRLLGRELMNTYQYDNYSPSSIPYSRFVRYLQQNDTQNSIDYWRGQLQGDVVADWPPLPRADYEAHARRFVRKCIPISQGDGHGVAMSNILRAAWGLVMSQYSGQADVIYAANISGRNAPVREVTEIAAPTITTVPVRIYVGREKSHTIQEFLDRVQQQAIDMIDHEHTGLQVIKSIAPELGDSVLKLRNLLVIQPATERDTHLDFLGLKLLPTAVADFDSYGLNVECTLGGEINVEARFDEDIVGTSYVDMVLDQFVHVVQQLCNPSIRNQQLGETVFLNDENRGRISKWNATVPQRVTRCIHEVIEEQAQSRPTDPAIFAWDGELTYSELTNMSKRLAHAIMALGIPVGPEKMIGLCMNKSRWVAVATLAILQTGSVVVPLGTTHPRSRIETIMKDTQAGLILVDSTQQARLAGLRPTLLEVDPWLLEHLPIQQHLPKTKVTHNNAAWIVYTSGTTGTPKGAVLEHGTLCTSIRAHGTRYGFSTKTRKLQYAAHTFDGMIEDYLSTLSWGGVCCVPSEDDRMNISRLTKFMRLAEVNSAAMTYTVARLIAPSDVPTMHTLVCGGEPATFEVTKAWMTNANFYNCYGPSECSIFSTANGPRKDIDELHNIGVPIGTRLWVVAVDDYNHLAPIGAPGELLIEGPQLARGYLNDETKTNASFIVDPAFAKEFGLPQGTRMYRSGDIVRQKEDGSLVYVARRDTQVKIRGQRVEVGEVEHQVANFLPDTRTVAVELLRMGPQEQPLLVAAIDFVEDSGHRKNGTTSLGTLPPTDHLRDVFEKLYSSLFRILPTYMVPTTFVPVAQMPRNLSGKLDRRALRELLQSLSSDDMQRYLAGETKAIPSTAMEQYIRSLWAKSLGISAERIGAHDNFFQIGGDSVAAMRLVAMSELRELELTVNDIFAHPRLSDLSKTLSERSGTSQDVEEDPKPFELWSPSNKVEGKDEAIADIAARCNVSGESIEDIYPCTPLQEGMIAITARQPAAYVSRQVYKLSTAQIDLKRFKATWQTLTTATPILRTRLLIGTDGKSIQIVTRDPISWEQGNDLDTYIHNDKVKGIKLGEPLVRYGLVTKSDGDFYFIWTAHHSIYDGWTMRAIGERFVGVYNGGDAASLTPGIPYSRFIRYLNRIDPKTAAAYWHEQLSGDVMADWPPLPRSDYQPKPRHRHEQRINIPTALQSEYLTSNVIRAAWAFVMAQYAGHSNVVFAASVSGRNAPVWQIGDIAAPTLTTIPVRINVDSSANVHQLIKAVQEQAVSMIRYEHTGLQKIKALVPSASDALDMRNVLVIQPATEKEKALALSGLESVPTPFEDFDSFGLHLECTLGSDFIEVETRYDENVVATSFLKQVVDQFEHIVKLFLDSKNGGQQLRSFQLNRFDQQQIFSWNKDVPSAVQRCIHEPIYTYAATRPTSPAVCSWDGDLTYADLCRLASRLAIHLTATLSIGPEQTVGICMNKSKWAVVAMLAVLSAGAVVVPLGVNHPIGRIGGILADSDCGVVLVDAEQASRLASTNVNLIKIDSGLANQLSNSSADIVPPRTIVRPDNLAWIVYTSGSTGTPKGVMLEHAALSSSLEAHGTAFGMDFATRTLQFAAHTFDAAIQDIFTTLYKGGCVCIPSEEDRMNNLTSAIVSFDANFINLTSTVASMLNPAELPSLKTMILAGEAVTPTAVGLWANHVTIFNSYGPSECSINSSCSEPVKEAARATNVGLPLSCNFWVVDPSDYNRLCPIGAPGELLIEGPIQARGYLNDKEKTDTSFVTDPAFTRTMNISGRRMYRTGDLFKQNADGTLNYLGRRDLQVKIRGQRVEIGEVEYQIKQRLAGARTIAVERLQHGANAERVTLIALMDFANTSEYHTSAEILPSGALAPSPILQVTFEKLKQSLYQALPSYMVPTTYLPLTKMPMNASNKLDRKAIRTLLSEFSPTDLQQYLKNDDGDKTAPTTETERKLQTIWATALGVGTDEIGIHDNFFQLGGDSVAAMRVVAATYSREMGITVADVFRHPRLIDLAVALAQRSDDLEDRSDEDPAPFDLWQDLSGLDIDAQRTQLAQVAAQCKVSVDQIDDIYPCTPLQAGLMTITARQPAAYVSRQVYSLAATVDKARFQAAWNTLAAEAQILRTRIIMGTRSWQVVTNETINWLYHTSLADYVESDRAEGMALGQPLVRYALIEQPSGECYFVWTSHHSLYDGWTLRSLRERLAQIYNQGFVDPCVPYQRFIRYLEQGRPDTTTTENYWRQQLGGDVTADWPSLPRNDYQPLPRDNIKQLVTLPAGHDQQTVAMSNALRAAWAIVMSQYANHSDVVFAATISGRNAPVNEITDIPAPTITTVPVRVHLDPLQDVNGFLQQVQEQAVDMIDYEHTGLQQIASLVPDLRSALELRNVLVIQPAGESDTDTSLDFPGVESIPMPVEPFNSYGVTVECKLGQSNILIDVHFDKDVISEANLRRSVDYFATMVERITDPQHQTSSLTDIMHVASADKEQILEWNLAVPPMVERCIHEMVEEQVIKTPQATAIESWDGDLTYWQYFDLSVSLAHHLTSLGVGPECMVGLCMDKSMWAPVAMLAIMQAGGAIMPLGTSHPLTRIDTIVRSSRARVIIVDPRQKERLAGLETRPNLSLVTITSDFIDNLTRFSATPNSGIKAENASWAIFTSGSTGVPKGVVINHNTMSTSIQEQGRWLGFDPNTRHLQFSSYTFDNCITDVFVTTTFGGCVCVPSEDERMNNLSSYMSVNRINTAMLTSTVARQLSPTELPAIRTLILTGEPVRADVVSTWLGHTNIYNAYGPTEGSMSTCTVPYTSSNQVTNVGFGLSTNLWITRANDQSQLCPIGAPGELWIEGPFLARGYLNDLERTRASFVVDPPFTQRLGLSQRRVYRTGDLVRQNEDGSLTHLGRIDTQVKIRGQRVEIGEIENQITKNLPAATTVAVELIESRLIAAIELGDDRGSHEVESQGSKPSKPSESLRNDFDKLRSSLYQSLPSYMVPAAFVPFAYMSRNLSGKLDRRALRTILESMTPAELFQYLVGDGPKAAPSTHIEIQLQQLWARALDTPAEQIGAHDNFFQIGGDSVAAMRLVAASHAYDLNLTVSDIFQHSRLSELAQVLAQRSESESSVEHTTTTPYSLIKTADVDAFIKDVVYPTSGYCSRHDLVDILPATDFQATTVASILTAEQAGLTHFLLDGQGLCDVEALKKTCLELIKHTETLRTAYLFHDDRLFQVIRARYEPEIRVIHTDDDIDAVTSGLVSQRMFHPPRLGEPFTQFAIIKNTTTSKHRVVMRVTHAEYDAVSFGSLWQRFGAIHHGVTLPPQPKFSTFVYDQRKNVSADTFAYWRRLLQGSTMSTLNASTNTVGHYLSKVDQTLSRRVRTAPISASGITTAILVKAAWAIVLGQLQTVPDIVFADTVSTRGTGDSSLVDAEGCCVNLVPVRVDLGRCDTVQSLLLQLREQQIHSMQHSQLGFREILHSCTEWPTSTRFTSALNHISTPESSVAIDGFEYTISMHEMKEALYSVDTSITTIQRGDDLEIKFAYLPARISDKLANRMLHELGDLIELFFQGPESSISGLLSSARAKQLKQVSIEDNLDYLPSSGAGITLTRMESALYLELKQSHLWQTVLRHRRGVGKQHSLSFSERGGDLVDAVRLSHLADQEGCRASATSILEGSRSEESGPMNPGVAHDK